MNDQRQSPTMTTVPSHQQSNASAQTGRISPLESSFASSSVISGTGSSFIATANAASRFGLRHVSKYNKIRLNNHPLEKFNIDNAQNDSQHHDKRANRNGRLPTIFICNTLARFKTGVRVLTVRCLAGRPDEDLAPSRNGVIACDGGTDSERSLLGLLGCTIAC